MILQNYLEARLTLAGRRGPAAGHPTGLAPTVPPPPTQQWEAGAGTGGKNADPGKKPCLQDES